MTKDLTEFAVTPRNKDGYAYKCKACMVIYVRDRCRTLIGRVHQIYNAQKAASKERGHQAPTYTKDELFAWCMQNGLENLWKAWTDSGYVKDLTPSADRLNPNQGYSLDNLRLVRWKENNEKAYLDRKAGVHVTTQCRKVQQLTFLGEVVGEYFSISAASRATGITRTNINAVCKEKPHILSAGGFLWKYI